MGLLEWLGFGSLPQAPTVSPALATPWTSSTLTPNVLFGDILGSAEAPMTRALAMSVPAVAKARHLICSTLSRQPLRTYRSEAVASTQPAWLYRTSGDVPPQLRMAYTLDDHLFFGWSLWAVQRGAGSQVVDAARVPKNRWAFAPDGSVLVDDKPVDAEQVILIPGPFEGLLTAAARTIRGAVALEDQWQNRVKNPVPITELHGTSADEPLEPAEALEMVNAYNVRRRDPEGVTVYTPHNVELKVHGDTAIELFVAGRNAVTLDVARHTGLPAVMLDASQVNASLTYSTKAEGRNDLLDALSNMWATPIEARLSMDDVTPRGQRVAFDLSNLLAVPQATTGPATED